MTVKHLTMEELEAGLETILQSPEDNGVLELIVRRPEVDERQVLQIGRLNRKEGLVGDNWKDRGSRQNPEVQLTLMNARVIALLSQDQGSWPLAGDQLYVDLDLSDENLPPGTRLSFGGAEIEVSVVPHTGCKKFMARFGLDAMKFVNSEFGKQHHFRGINARIIRDGAIGVGDVIRKI